MGFINDKLNKLIEFLLKLEKRGYNNEVVVWIELLEGLVLFYK